MLHSLVFKANSQVFILVILARLLIKVQCLVSPEVVRHLDQKFQIADLIPDLIPLSPSEGPLRVRFTYEGEQVPLRIGETLAPEQAAKPPHLKYDGNQHQLYTLIMVDPDVPSKKLPALKSVLHWLVVNIPGDQLHLGSTLAAYRPPNPLRLTGDHRYVFLVYHQKKPIDISKMPVMPKDNTLQRVRFRLSKFVQDHQLGRPRFGNFFYSHRP